MTKSILFWMWIIVVVGMIVSILTLLIHCLHKPKKTCVQQNESCANSQQCCDNLYCSTVVGEDYKCVNCIPQNDKCENQEQCCSGLNCNSGICEKCVSKIGGPCGKDSLCCAPLQCGVNSQCVNCITIGGDCSGGPCCNELKCNSENKCHDPNCSKPCGDGKKCCSDQYCDASSNNCVDCKKKDESCELSTDCCGNNICIDKKCSENKEFEPMGAFLIVNTEKTQSVSIDGHDITWVDRSTAWDASTSNFWFWSFIQDKLYLGVEVKVSNIGNRYYVMDPVLNETITLLGENNNPQDKNIKLNNDGTITNTTETLFLTEDLKWSSNKSECYAFTIVVPSGSKIGGTCIKDENCALPYQSCTEGSCVACYQNGRANCNTSFFNRCNQKNPNKFNWECVVPSQTCGTPTIRCKDTEIQSCNPLTRKWECLNQPSGQCSPSPPPPDDGFLCEPPDKFQPMCNPNTNNNWICKSICTEIPDVKCNTDYVPICYPDETTGLYNWHCVPKSSDSCDSVPFSPNCLEQDNIILYDSSGHCSRKCPYDMTKNDLLNYLGSSIDLVTDIPVV
jgi:hypothetical protein